jgi:hypothetical protein
MGYTNRDLCAVLFDQPGHLTLQNIVDMHGTTREHVEGFYRKLQEAKLVRILDQVDGERGVDVPPLVESFEVLVTCAETLLELNLNASLPKAKKKSL